MLRAGSLEEGAEEIRDFAGRSTFPDSWRIYARSAGDDKGPDPGVRVGDGRDRRQPRHNIKVILHGEEEGGGPALDYVIKNHAEKLRSDVLIIVDGPQHPSGKPTVYYGARGGAGLDSDGLHGEECDAQRQLRQLAARRERAPVAASCVDGGSDGQGGDRRVLRRCACRFRRPPRR